MRRALGALLACALLLPGQASGRALALAPAPQPASDTPAAITAKNAVVWDPAAERVVWGRRERVGVPMASTTKIMTTLLAVEAGTLDDLVSVSARAAAAGGASLGLRAGDRLPMASLLAGLMLRSGNDAAVAVAEHVAGDVPAFVARMNARARELGLRDTHFVNPSGLTDDRAHRASALDLALLTKAAMAHDAVRRWAAARTLTVPGLPPMVNRNELVGRYPGATGVKTGYLAHAGYALVASARRDGLELYAVVLGSTDSFGDAGRLLDWAYARYRLARPAEPGAAVATYRWSDGAVPLIAANGLAAAVRREAQVHVRLRLEAWAPRPVAAGARLGTLELVEDGQVVAGAALTTRQAIGAPPHDAPSGDASSADAVERAGRALQDALRGLVRASGTERPA